jgi:hypothetical protein
MKHEPARELPPAPLSLADWDADPFWSWRMAALALAVLALGLAGLIWPG